MPEFSEIVLHDIAENAHETSMVALYPQVYLTGINRRVFAAFADVLNEKWIDQSLLGEFQHKSIQWETPYDKPVYVNIVFKSGISEPRVEVLRDKLLGVMAETLRQMAGYVSLDKAYDDRVDHIALVPILHPDEHAKAEALDEEDAQRQLASRSRRSEDKDN